MYCCAIMHDDSMRSTFMSLFQTKGLFTYRRVYNVTVCDALKISEEDPIGEEGKLYSIWNIICLNCYILL